MFYRIQVLFDQEWHEGRMLDIDHIDQRVTFNLGGIQDLTAPFRHVQNVALCEDSGEVVQNFGAPKNAPSQVNTYAPCPTCTARHQDAPLMDAPKYFEMDYCHECMKIHMIEKTRRGQVICRGENYYNQAQKARTHYTHRLGKGFELIAFDRQYPLDWQMAFEAKEPEYVDVDQDW